MGLLDKLGGDRPLSDLQNMAAEFDDLFAQDNARLTRYKQYRDENNTIRDPDMAYMTSDVADYGRATRNSPEPTRHNIPLPLGLAQTVKHTFRISGQLPDVVVDERESTETERYRSDAMEKIVWAILRASGSEQLFSSGAWDGSQLGATCIDLWMDMGKNMPVASICDPAGVVVVPGVRDPHDFLRLYRCWDVPVKSLKETYKDKLFRGEPVKVGEISASFSDSGFDVVKVISACDKGKQTMFAHGKQSVVGLEEYQHDYGFVPYIVIPNIGKYEDVYGYADYEFIRALQFYMSALFSRQADVIRAVANGAYIERKTGQSPDAIKKAIRTGGVIPSRIDGSIDPIQAGDMPGFLSEHQAQGMDFFKMLGFTPDAAWGMPGSSSGQDRGMQLQPLLEYTAMKQMNWQRGLARLFEYAFRMVEQKMVGTSTYRGTKPNGPAGQTKSFAFRFGPDAETISSVQNETDPLTGDPVILDFPRNPRELFDGDYSVRFVWRNRLDPDDPSFITSELSKFSQGAQSLKTTLERLGVEAPEDEMRRLESESKRFPWVNQGTLALLLAQLKAGEQGQGGGNPGDSMATDNAQALDQMGNAGGAGAPADAQLGALPGAPSGPQYGF